MRTKNAILSTTASLSFEVLVLLCGFIFPRLIILTYGSVVNGLTSTINQILAVINLLQAGAVGASTYEMYKPVQEHNAGKYSIILDSSITYFRRLGGVFLGITMLAIPYVAWSQSDSGIPSWAIALSVVILGLNASYSFFFIAKHDIVFSAFQNRFWLSIGRIVEKVVYYAILYLVLLCRLHFVFMYITLMLGCIVKITFYAYIYNKKYRSKFVSVEKPNHYKVKSRGYLMCNQIAIQAVTSAPVLIISNILTLEMVSVFAVYNYIQTSFRTIFNAVQLSFAPGFGNLAAASDDEKVSEVFDTFSFLFYMVGLLMYICASILFMPFIYLYTKGMTDVNYIVPVLIPLTMVYSATVCLYQPYNMLVNSYGLFKETYLQTMISGAIAIAISIVSVIKWGMPYVTVGMIFFYLFNFLYRVWLIRKKKPLIVLTGLLRRMLIILVVPIILYLVSVNVLVLVANSWIQWLLYSVITCFGGALLILSYCLLFERRELKDSVIYIRSILRKK